MAMAWWQMAWSGVRTATTKQDNTNEVSGEARFSDWLDVGKQSTGELKEAAPAASAHQSSCQSPAMSTIVSTR